MDSLKPKPNAASPHPLSSSNPHRYTKSARFAPLPRLVHNHIKPGSVIMAKPTLNARICHLGTAILCGDAVEEEQIEFETEIMRLKRSNSEMFQGSRGYMSPKFQSTGIGTQGKDVYALGVVIRDLVILVLVSGDCGADVELFDSYGEDVHTRD